MTTRVMHANGASAPRFCFVPNPAKKKKIQQQVETYGLTSPPQLDIQALQGVGRVPFLQREPSKQAASHTSPQAHTHTPKARSGAAWETSTPSLSPILSLFFAERSRRLAPPFPTCSWRECVKKLCLAERLLFCMNERRREKTRSVREAVGETGGKREGVMMLSREGRTGGGSNSPQVFPAGVNRGKQRVGLWEVMRG